MTDVWIRYNPYTVKTEIKINNTSINPSSPLYYVTDLRLQSWIEPRGHWQGIFQELRKQTGERRIQIRFHGTAYDFADFKYACERYGIVFDKIDLAHVNKDTCNRHGQDDKIQQLVELYSELQQGPIEEFKTADIKNAFAAAINTDFKIVVVAPMSSGKSTLINSILGRDLLPAVNEATTAVITQIRDNDDATKFTVTAKDMKGQPICYRIKPDGSFAEDSEGRYILDKKGKVIAGVEATPKLIEQLNSAIDPKDTEGRRALLSIIEIEGPIPALPSTRLKTVFVDTPGGNNAQNEEHGRLMTEAIQDEEKSLILYVFNGTQTGTYDSEEILSQIADEMQRSSNGKQSRDRFLFVANRMDDFDPTKEPYPDYIENTILPGLSQNGIQEPNLFLVSARLAKLLRMKKAGEPLTKKEKGDLAAWLVTFGDVSEDDSYCLYNYSSITDRQKDSFTAQVHALSKEDDENSVASIAEINSGVPALEMSIRDYVEKYALSIKIKNAHDSFMRKVNSRRIVDEREKVWASSKDNLEKVRQEIKIKRKNYDENRTLADFRGKIDGIGIDRKKILIYEARLRDKIDRISKSNNKTIKKEHAETTLRAFHDDLESTLQAAGEDLVRIINTEVLQPCNSVMEAYVDYVNRLNDGGFLDLGGIRVKELDGFDDLSICSVDEMLRDDDYVFEKKEKVGTRSYKKSGFFNAIKRLFGVGGWGTEDEMEKVEYIKVSELIQDKITESMEMFHEEIERSIEEADAQVKRVKKQAYKRLNRVDERIKKLLDVLEKKTADEVRLKAEVQANADNYRWIKDFVARVDSLLEIE